MRRAIFGLGGGGMKEPTAEDLRRYLIDVLSRREAICRDAATDPGRSAKRGLWEAGRADAYKDFRYFLIELDMRGMVKPSG